MLLLAMLAHPAAAVAQDLYTFSVSLLGGVGGSLAGDGGDFGNSTFQLGFSAMADRRTHFSVRAGQLDFGSEELETLTDASLSYVALTGEYRATEGFYESALFLGIGVYNLDARRIGGGSVDDTSFGAMVGVLGDFEITRKWVARLEGAVHYADVEKLELHVTAQAGVAYRF